MLMKEISADATVSMSKSKMIKTCNLSIKLTNFNLENALRSRTRLLELSAINFLFKESAQTQEVCIFSVREAFLWLQVNKAVQCNTGADLAWSIWEGHFEAMKIGHGPKE